MSKPIQYISNNNNLIQTPRQKAEDQYANRKGNTIYNIDSVFEVACYALGNENKSQNAEKLREFFTKQLLKRWDEFSPDQQGDFEKLLNSNRLLKAPTEKAALWDQLNCYDDEETSEKLDAIVSLLKGKLFVLVNDMDGVFLTLVKHAQKHESDDISDLILPAFLSLAKVHLATLENALPKDEYKEVKKLLFPEGKMLKNLFELNDSDVGGFHLRKKKIHNNNNNNNPIWKVAQEIKGYVMAEGKPNLTNGAFLKRAIWALQNLNSDTYPQDNDGYNGSRICFKFAALRDQFSLNKTESNQLDRAYFEAHPMVFLRIALGRHEDVAIALESVELSLLQELIIWAIVYINQSEYGLEGMKNRKTVLKAYSAQGGLGAGTRSTRND